MNPYEIYVGSNGDATKALYAKLETLGVMGLIAMNLFRACKCSERAKKYSRRYKGEAYDRKNWSMGLLVGALLDPCHSKNHSIVWGWKEDPMQEFHKWVLYIELPTGQVSFHAAARGRGPDYTGKWDGIREASAQRIIRFVETVLNDRTWQQDAARQEKLL